MSGDGTDGTPVPGIAGVGAYVPRYRLAAETVTEAWGQFHGAGIETTAVPAGDEDPLTMAYEAGRRALAAADVEASTVGGLFVGTTTPPVEEEAPVPRLASTLGLGLDAGSGSGQRPVDPRQHDIDARQHTGSTRAGVDALVAGLDAVTAASPPEPTDHDPSATDAASGADPVLVVATDAPRGAPDDEIEHAAGAGAAAIVLAPGAVGTIEDRAECVAPRPGTRFRERGAEATTGLGITEYDRSAFVRPVVAAVEDLDADAAAADALALQSPNGALPYRVAGPLGVEPDAIARGTVVHDVGDVGAASPLLGLAAALEDGADSVLLVGYGSGGGATALALDAGGGSAGDDDGGADRSDEAADRAVPVAAAIDRDRTVELSYAESLRLRGDVTPGEPVGGGAYVSVPSWVRTLPQRHRLVAGRCPECGALAFPPEGACAECGVLPEYDLVRLPGTGTVETATVIGQGGAPPEFVEQQARSGPYVSAIVALDGPDGGAVSVPAQVIDVPAGQAVDIGDRVAATIRRLYTQEGVTRYGVKLRPIEDASG